MKLEYTGNNHKYLQTTIVYEGLPVIVFKRGGGCENKDVLKNEFATVVSFNDDFIKIKSDRWEIDVATDKFLNYFQIGYCFSVYKSQGATADGNVNILDYGYMKTKPRCIYTALSRAKKLSVLTCILEN